MLWSRYFVETQKELPKDATIPSHVLMLKSGMVRQIGSGAYAYLPIGMRTLLKVTNIVREELNAAGAIELLMPALQPMSLWQETGRDEVLGEVLIRFTDRHGRENAIGPTHEEVITDIVRSALRSYKQLPVTLYQIQTKFRDEERPRAGIIRTREFIMMDAYSFDTEAGGLDESYRKMYDAYAKAYDRCGLDWTAVEADTGAMGGDVSHEFMVLTPNGEDSVAVVKDSGYAANIEKCPCPKVEPAEPGTGALEEVHTPGAKSVEDVCALLKKKPSELLKTLLYDVDGETVAVLLRGDYEINEMKLSRHFGGRPVAMASAATVREVSGCDVGFSGPVRMKKKVRVIADYSVAAMTDIVTGANKTDHHLLNVNRERDFTPDEYADLRCAVAGDPSPDGNGTIEIERAVEVGHIFKLGTKYSQAMGATYLDAEGKSHPAIMGCYGIGVNRIIAGIIEKSHDDDGIIWPRAVAPFEAVIVVAGKKPETIALAERLYADFAAAGIETICDDRNARAGVKFKDADLIGFPLRVVVGDRNAKENKVELKLRAWSREQTETVEADAATARACELLDISEEVRKTVVE